ncbi:MAG: PEP-CTERM sorting domain-containing protein [Acidobacteria bacterium]|nr:PEP-CTERM sorting domain-containing protein [Acidobacteriota bacterium]
MHLSRFAFALLAAGSAMAAPISYLESVGGDLPTIGGLPVFTFDVGSNTVSGVAGFTDFDSFAFVIPVGMSLDSASIATTAAGSYRLKGSLRTGSSVSLGTLLANWDAIPPGTLILSSTPSGPGTYHIWHSENTTSLAGTNPTNYTWTFAVSSTAAVPEPTIAGMTAAGLLGLFALRRRR